MDPNSNSNSNKIIAIVFGALVVLLLVIFFTANAGSGGGGGGAPAGGGEPSSETPAPGSSQQTAPSQTTPTTPSEGEGEAIQLSGLPTVRTATDEEKGQILPHAEKLIEGEHPDFQGVVPDVTASVMNGETILYARYEGTPFEPSPGVSIENTLIVMLNPNGEVSVALSN
jgi:hypothetical protein